jgi:hypothetical protein
MLSLFSPSGPSADLFVRSMTSMSIYRFGGKEELCTSVFFGRFNAYQKTSCIDLQLDDAKNKLNCAISVFQKTHRLFFSIYKQMQKRYD